MKEVSKFNNSFWNEQIGNFQGLEVVLRKLKDGRQVLKEYSEFLRQRALIEEQFGKSLVKLSKTIGMRDEIPPMRYVWEVLRSETENSGLCHIKTAHQLLAEAAKITDLFESYREKRRIREEVVRIHQQNLKQDWKRASDAKRNYELRCSEEILTNQLYHQEVARIGKNSREAEKALSKHLKVRQALHFSESEYQSSVSLAEETRKNWEKETERTLLSFQGLEEDRLTSLRDSLWKTCNVISAASVDDDGSMEEIRKTLETCDLEEVMAAFIAENATGDSRPSPIIFKQQLTSSSAGLGRASSTSFLTARSPSPASSLSSKESSANANNNNNHVKNWAYKQQENMSVTRPFDVIQNCGYLYGSTNQINQGMGTLSSRPPSRPKKPPRLLISASYANHLGEQETRPIIDTVDNTEYFNLPDRTTPQIWPECLSHSDFSNDQTASRDSSIHSTTPPKVIKTFSRQSSGPFHLSDLNETSTRRYREYSLPSSSRYAMVLQEYKGSTTTDMILCKNQIVQVIDSNLDSDWWRVQDGMGRERYYPSQYLKLMTKSKAADPHYN